jgi:hypothetical protein
LHAFIVMLAPTAAALAVRQLPELTFLMIV